MLDDIELLLAIVTVAASSLLPVLIYTALESRSYDEFEDEGAPLGNRFDLIRVWLSTPREYRRVALMTPQELRALAGYCGYDFTDAASGQWKYHAAGRSVSRIMTDSLLIACTQMVDRSGSPTLTGHPVGSSRALPILNSKH